MTLLDNSMFDDGSFECFNYWIADCDGCYQVSHNDTLIQHYKTEIIKAQKRDERYILTPGAVYGCNEVFDIRWG